MSEIDFVTGIVVGFVIAGITGFFLQLKKESDWIQPPTQKGTGEDPTVSFDRILESAKTVPEAGIQGWDDIERLDVRPSKGMVKVRAKNSWEIQVDTETGDVLQVAKRRSEWGPVTPGVASLRACGTGLPGSPPDSSRSEGVPGLGHALRWELE